MQIKFWKYHGTGNDFIMLDGRTDHIVLTTDVIKNLCDRHFGIGADGLIIIENSKEADFHMQYFNADGNQGSMCGNGGRCAAAFFDFLSGPLTKCTLNTSDGIHHAEISSSKTSSGKIIRLSMNDVERIEKKEKGYFLDTGSPHFVLSVKKIEHVDILRKGPKIRYSKVFQPSGTNVNFMEIDDDKIYLRTYERGVENETLSCGTGVTAAAIVYSEIKGMQEASVNITTRGGKLNVSFTKEGGRYVDIFLEGSAKSVFSGEIEI